MKPSTVRSRWAALGAAVAVSLGAGGIGISHATISSGERAVFVPLDDPCRLASTRPAPHTVGPRTTGIGPEESYTLDGWGTEGNCTLPSNTAALALNVTAVNASQQTNLRFFPADAAVPTTANLNPSPGAPPTPNAVNVTLDSSGQFKVFNKFGVVEVVIDVMGYYEDHNHDDRYYQKSEVDTALAGKADKVTTLTGVLNEKYVGGSGFTVTGDSFPAALPAGTPLPTIERITPPTFSANCPGFGQAESGFLCLYEHNIFNIGSVFRGGFGDPEALYGFELDVFPTTAANNGYYLAAWAYQPAPPAPASASVADQAPTGVGTD